MGYSGRYHAASLAAVFVALAIGILIGIGLSDDVVTAADKGLEDSLRSDLDDRNSQVDDLTAQLEQQREFGDRAGPALVAGRLDRQDVALVELGDVSDDTTEPATSAVETAGGTVPSQAILALPPDLPALYDAAGGKYSNARPNQALASGLGTAIGRQLVGGGPLVEKVRDVLFERFSGDLSKVSRVVLVAKSPDDLQADLKGDGRSFELALLRGLDEASSGTVGVENTSTDPTTLDVFSNAGIATVDDIDRTPGQVALVYALLGAKGDFGVKNGATSLLPDLVAPTSAP
jgi:copper transport outer membrane protein MctB